MTRMNSRIIRHLTEKLSLIIVLTLFFSCNSQHPSENSNTGVVEQSTTSKIESTTSEFTSNIVSELGSNVLCIFQDKNDHYWFGTQDKGVFRFNGKTLIQFTAKDGLPDNQVQTIQEDNSGNIWFGTGGFGVCKFDGKTITVLTNSNGMLPISGDENKWQSNSDDLWFHAGGGAYRYNGTVLTYLPFPAPDKRNSNFSSTSLGPKSVYCIMKDHNGNIWFGTQSNGVCCYSLSSEESSGNSFSWLSEKGLSGPAVLALFEDKNGTMWFGNNGSGVFNYDGKSLVNFTSEHSLSNEEFYSTSRISGKSGPGTLARIYSINEDKKGHIWIGTVDAGAWRYDGTNLTNFTLKDGLSSDAVTVIYKDKKGELWFGTSGKGVCKFNGTSFSKVEFNKNVN